MAVLGSHSVIVSLKKNIIFDLHYKRGFVNLKKFFAIFNRCKIILNKNIYTIP